MKKDEKGWKRMKKDEKEGFPKENENLWKTLYSILALQWKGWVP